MERAYVLLEAIVPIAVKPRIASIGGFSVKDSKTGRCIIFDWEESCGGTNISSDNVSQVLQLDWDTKNFDYDFFESQADDKSSVYLSSERLKELIKLDEEGELEKFLTECELGEVRYECYIGHDEDVHIPMRVVEFSIGDYSFSKEQLDRYNKTQLEIEKDYWVRMTQEWFQSE